MPLHGDDVTVGIIGDPAYIVPVVLGSGRRYGIGRTGDPARRIITVIVSSAYIVPAFPVHAGDVPVPEVGRRTAFVIYLHPEQRVGSGGAVDALSPSPDIISAGLVGSRCYRWEGLAYLTSQVIVGVLCKGLGRPASYCMGNSGHLADYIVVIGTQHRII